MSNTVIAYVTVECYKAWRDYVNGSWFVKMLVFVSIIGHMNLSIL